MKRGEIWTSAGGADYAGKPRPSVIVQDDRFGALESVTLVLFTSNDAEALLYRPLIEPSPTNALKEPSRLMADKVMTIPTSKLGQHIGTLSEEDLLRLNRAMLTFLGLA